MLAGQYCMPEEGVTLSQQSQLLSSREVELLTQLFCLEGVDKVRLTGGEPLVRKDLVEIVSKLFCLILTLTVLIVFLIVCILSF